MPAAGTVVRGGRGGWAEVEGFLLYAVGEEGFGSLGGVGAREEGLGDVLFWGWGCHFCGVWLLIVVVAN